MRRLILTLALAGMLGSAHAVQTRIIRDDGYELFGEGRLESVALSKEGDLFPSYRRDLVGPAGAELVWDAIREPAGTVLAATGHEGRLIRVIDENTSQTIATLPDPELTTMLALGDGSVLVAGAPSGSIYRLLADDSITTMTQVDASWIWDMERDAQGRIWVATGTGGKLFRVTPTDNFSTSTVELIHDFHASNLLDLWIDADGVFGAAGAVYIAGQDPGWLFRHIPGQEGVEVIFNAESEEIRRILPMPDGLALALNTERSPTQQALSLTLRMGQTVGSLLGGGGNGSPSVPPQLAQAFTKGKNARYQNKNLSEVVLLSHDGFMRSLWQSSEQPIHDLTVAGSGSLFIAAGSEGRLYEVDLDGKTSVVTDLREDYITRILPAEFEEASGYLLATARNGAIYRMDSRRATQGAHYLSRPLSGGVPVRWGSFVAHGDFGQTVQVAFRTSEDGEMDSQFWGEWTAESPLAAGTPVQIGVAPSRFLQYRLSFTGDAPQAPRIDYVEATFIEPNAAPRIQKFEIGDAPAPQRPGAPSNGPKPPTSGGGQPNRNSPAADAGLIKDIKSDPHSNSMTVSLAWQVEDPNGDDMIYALYFRSTDETEWKLIDDELKSNSVGLPVGSVADGRYRFKVIASDAPANPMGMELTSEKISDLLIVDNSGPVFEDFAASVDGQSATITFGIRDAVSPLSVVKMDLDNGDVFPLLPLDGLLDEPAEQFSVTFDNLEAGEHVLTVSATDRRGNTTVAKHVFRR